MTVHSHPQANTMDRRSAGFSLVEMLVTTLILGLVSTLLATGIPVAADTYRKTVNSSNAQLALSTTMTVLRSELGTATEVLAYGNQVYYQSSEGYWVSIGNSDAVEGAHGLTKQYWMGSPDTSVEDDVTDTSDEDDVTDTSDEDDVNGLIADDDAPATRLLPDDVITDALWVSFGSVACTGNVVEFNGLAVRDRSGNELASAGDSYQVLLRFVE